MKRKLESLEDFFNDADLQSEWKFKELCAVNVLCSFIETGRLEVSKELAIQEAWNIAELMAEERARRL